MILKRKILNSLIEWKNQEGRTALLIEGARRTGKSFIAQYFAKNYYASSLIIDFSKADEELKQIFLHNRNSLDTFFLLLETYFNTKLIKRNALIVFDEVQRFPIAREFIKTLVADGRYDYLETGSLLSIKQNIKNIVLPSEEEKLELRPLDFEEFLWAMDDTISYNTIIQFFNKKQSVGPALHRKFMLLFRQYMIIGGMPQVVLSYVQNKNFVEADKINRNILSLYRDDRARFAIGYEDKVRAIFDNIPAFLSNQNKQINYSKLSPNGRFRDYNSAFLWLSDAMITNDCYLTKDPNVGLALTQQINCVKCYMADTGLLISMSLWDNTFSNEDLYKQLMFKTLALNEGMFVENIVAQMLVYSGHNLFFHESNSKTKEDRMKIDFLISKGSPIKNKLFPIEVKSSKNYTYSSLNKFKTKYSSRIGGRYIIHDKDLQIKDDIILLPFYMTQLI